MLILGHVVQARRLHSDLIAAGQVNTEYVQGWDWFVWDFHPSISIGLFIFSAAYIWLIGPARRRWSLGPAASRSEKTFFFIGIVLLELSLDGPIHHLADNYLFFVHMFQHLIITLITPLLLLAGIPGWVWDLILKVPLVGRLFRWCVHPVRAFLTYNLVMIAFHIPSAYNVTMVNHDMHIVEHLAFMSAAMLVWWPILSRSEKMPPLSWGAQMIYLLAMSLPMKALGAVITVKQEVLYGFYAAAPRVWGISPTGDQRMGGLMMWLPAGMVLWFLAGRAFTLWRKEDLRQRLPSGMGVVLLALLVAQGCTAPAEPLAKAEVVSPANELYIGTSKKLYSVTLVLPDPLVANDMFVLKVRVTGAGGKAIARAKIKVGATMPQHGHGMMTDPRPAPGSECDAQGFCKAKDGVFEIDGYRLHMRGAWLFQVEVIAEAGRDSGERSYEF
jgi:cytochrome c oxidase assembly factor CtaG